MLLLYAAIIFLFLAISKPTISSYYELSMNLQSQDYKVNPVAPGPTKTHRRQGSGALRQLMSPTSQEEKGRK